jgi:hypothetical protein
MKRLLVLSIWFPATLATLFLSLVTFRQLVYAENLERLLNRSVNKLIKNPYEMFSALPKTLGVMDASFKTEDARPEILRQYLIKQHSPMAPYSEELFAAGEKYGLDYRLMAAIAMCESNLCKKAPDNSYNCWGFENGETQFRSWEHAFERVAKTLKEGYIDQGLDTPEEIMPKYAPPSVAKGGPWAKCVNQFLKELE